MRTLWVSIKWSTYATRSLLEGPVMLILLSMMFPILLLDSVIPAYEAVGRESEALPIILLTFLISACMVVMAALMTPKIWKRVKDDLKINEAAGFNKVGQQERQDMDRYDAASAYLKMRRKRAKASLL